MTKIELQILYWNAFEKLEESRFEQFELSVLKQNVHVLKDLMDQLVLYYSLSADARWHDEAVKVGNAMK
jgi:hypothetical protein